jgi:hypothetical protein
VFLGLNADLGKQCPVPDRWKTSRSCHASNTICTPADHDAMSDRAAQVLCSRPMNPPSHTGSFSGRGFLVSFATDVVADR